MLSFCNFYHETFSSAITYNITFTLLEAKIARERMWQKELSKSYKHYIDIKETFKVWAVFAVLLDML